MEPNKATAILKMANTQSNWGGAVTVAVFPGYGPYHGRPNLRIHLIKSRFPKGLIPSLAESPAFELTHNPWLARRKLQSHFMRSGRI
jgi:hypothetical protein